MLEEEQIAQIRRFNRCVARRIGALEDRYLGQKRPLGEARILFEVGRGCTSVSELRGRLELDSGYLSRLLRSLETQGLVRTIAGSSDRRYRTVRLTRRGQRQSRDLDRRSHQLAASLLQPLSARSRRRLATAMAEVEHLLQVSTTRFDRVVSGSSDAQWCLKRYYEELALVFEESFDVDRALPVATGELVPPRGAFLVGNWDGQPIACGAVLTLEPGVGYIKRMWVAPRARGVGLGKRLLLALEEQARHLGHSCVRLETNRALTAAIEMYRACGYREVAPFIDEPYADHWFEKNLPAAPE